MLINLTGNAFGFGLGSEFRQFLIDAGIIRLETLILRNTNFSFRGIYVEKEKEWRQSGTCQVAGFLAMLSMTGAGQMSIYYNIRKARKEAGNQRRQQDMTIARRLFLIVFTDFCCWFPIGVMGLLASKGTPVPGVVNVWAAVFVLPLNSALNPFLYTLITLQARREKMRMENMVQRTLHRLKLEVLKWPDDKVEDLLQYLVKAKASQRLRLMSEQGNTLAVTNSEKDRISTSEQITQVSDLEVELRQANKEVTSDTAENSETTSV
nr:hypothetical protein BaRGS_009598 [Batillaria attramentaria]